MGLAQRARHAGRGHLEGIRAGERIDRLDAGTDPVALGCDFVERDRRQVLICVIDADIEHGELGRTRDLDIDDVDPVVGTLGFERRDDAVAQGFVGHAPTLLPYKKGAGPDVHPTTLGKRNKMTLVTIGSLPV